MTSVGMVNMFYSYIQAVTDFQNIKKEMKFYEKINPIYIIRIRKVKNQLFKFIDNIRESKITKRMLIDFQRVYLVNQGLSSFDLINVEYHEGMEIQSFYNMEFCTYDLAGHEQNKYPYGLHVRIIGDVVELKFGAVRSIFTDEPNIIKPEEQEMHNIIKDRMCKYFQSFL